MGANWDSINEGDELAPQNETVKLLNLVQYSAGSGDFNPLHHDYNFPQSKQIGSIIIHGRCKYAKLDSLPWLRFTKLEPMLLRGLQLRIPRNRNNGCC